jgi:transposase
MRCDLRSGAAPEHALRAGQEPSEQQGRLMVHRARQGFVEQRTATLNRIRGLLSEVGIVLPLKAATVRSGHGAAGGPARLGQHGHRRLLSEVQRLDERILAYDRHIALMARQDDRASS